MNFFCGLWVEGEDLGIYYIVFLVVNNVVVFFWEVVIWSVEGRFCYVWVGFYLVMFVYFFFVWILILRGERKKNEENIDLFMLSWGVRLLGKVWEN